MFEFNLQETGDTDTVSLTFLHYISDSRRDGSGDILGETPSSVILSGR